jgi:type I restriction enzyme S subunit
MEHVASHTQTLLGTISSKEMKSTAFHFQRGDILYGRLRPYLNKVLCAEFEGLCSSEFIVLPWNGAFVPQYLARYLGTKEFVDFANQLNQGDRPRVSFEQIAGYTIPLPPLHEQERIVAKCDMLLSKVSNSNERLDRIPAILKRFRQAVVAAACMGGLTADWRKENPDTETASTLMARLCGREWKQFECQGADLLPEGWAYVRFKGVSATIRGGSTVPPQLKPTPFPILRSSSVRPGHVDLNDVRFVQATDSQNRDNFIQDGDLLFTRLSGSIEYVANCAVIQNLGERQIQYPDRLFCARLKDPSMVHYAVLCFGSSQVRAEITEHAKSSAGHQRVSITDISGQAIPLPPLREQHEIVRRVKALFALADQLEAHYRRAHTQVDRITASILAKAFRGELVPTEAELAKAEGRSYETAEELIARIRTVEASRSIKAQKVGVKKASRARSVSR